MDKDGYSIHSYVMLYIYIYIFIIEIDDILYRSIMIYLIHRDTHIHRRVNKGAHNMVFVLLQLTRRNVYSYVLYQVMQWTVASHDMTP